MNGRRWSTARPASLEIHVGGTCPSTCRKNYHQGLHTWRLLLSCSCVFVFLLRWKTRWNWKYKIGSKALAWQELAKRNNVQDRSSTWKKGWFETPSTNEEDWSYSLDLAYLIISCVEHGIRIKPVWIWREEAEEFPHRREATLKFKGVDSENFSEADSWAPPGNAASSESSCDFAQYPKRKAAEVEFNNQLSISIW